MGDYLVKADQREPEYLEIAPDLRGYAWTPYQSRAHRFTERKEARKVAEDHDAYVVRLKARPGETERVGKLREALGAALAVLEDIGGYSGSAGNWPLHDAIAKARAALDSKSEGRK